MNRPLVLHPFLFALFPALALLAQNLDWVPVSDAVRALILSVFLSALLLGAIWIVTRDLAKAGLITTIALFLFFSYGHLYGALKDAGHGATLARHRYLVPTLSVLLVGGSIGVLRYLRDARSLTVVFNIISAALLVLPVFAIAQQALSPGVQLQQASQRLSLPAGASPPDIYYIVVDGYGRQDTLQTVYELDNEPFLEALEEQGFSIARSARANYAQTSLALASALNMQYVDDLVPSSDQGREVLWQLIQDNEARKQLEDLGYKIVAFESGLSGTEWRDADLYMSPSSLGIGTNVFESMLAHTTALRLATDGAVALPRLLPILNYPYELHRERLRYTLKNLADLPPSSEPRFVFAHLILPHPPFVFDAGGRSITPEAPFSLDYPSGGTAEGYIRGYQEQVKYLNRELERVVESILANADLTPVIVIQADHGPDSNSGRQNYTQERMTILNAQLVPGHGGAVYAYMTPVNTFRVIFSEMFGGDYERLPDRALMSQYETPYEFIDVTGSVLPP